ncbi:uncharacterized protein MELLADRAFT_58552 [Melampsora larici-populina 98AG31]|uniref:Uncharacterized protein n=1 Tax=Melampsora larici-populina (strain 98AG31 / pathotype 3-4-7) TaxID=747676 RepID=F4R3X9_MELLP|nr:uncharacterized protein MELLADRAFT_58552 [Melampsora larici-populina 98AG31]EGG13085.1 hypothetical protein MELLADRAFT_58552 [Melampsora larici-populina 98AG31]
MLKNPVTTTLLYLDHKYGGRDYKNNTTHINEINPNNPTTTTHNNHNNNNCNNSNCCGCYLENNCQNDPTCHPPQLVLLKGPRLKTLNQSSDGADLDNHHTVMGQKSCSVNIYHQISIYGICLTWSIKSTTQDNNPQGFDTSDGQGLGNHVQVYCYCEKKNLQSYKHNF